METLYMGLWLFFCYAFLGWLGETALAAVRQRRYVDRSLLFGPLCVVYGIVGPLIGVALRDLAGNWFFLFLGSAIYASVAEWLAGHTGCSSSPAPAGGITLTAVVTWTAMSA